jgi:murein DD-endopeptidase MepM/ murein hydrolase activator NlpD
VALAAGASLAKQAPVWPGSRNIETVSPEDVAPEDLDSRAERTQRRNVIPLPADEAPQVDEREQLAAFGDQLSRLWDAIPSYSPVNAASRLTSGFGWRRGPLSGKREFHGGIDLAAARGTSVVATADGVVEAVFFDDASGRVVVLAHGNGMETLYGHLDAALVTPGEDVKRGAEIGKVGTTGWRSTGPHLHYAIRVETKYVDPRRYLFEKVARFGK